MAGPKTSHSSSQASESRSFSRCIRPVLSVTMASSLLPAGGGEFQEKPEISDEPIARMLQRRCTMTRFLIRSLKYSAVLVLVLASAGAIFGPWRVREVLSYVKAAAVQNVDGMIPDEVKLRNDIEKLRE